MPRVDDFDAFYASTSEDVLRVFYALTGDRAVARDATIDAYRHAWRDWSKIRTQDPQRYVRIEAWKAQAVTRGTHPLRRRHEEDSDTELLDALTALPSDDRRLLVLMTLGATDLDVAAREIGVGDEEAIELVTTAITTLEQSTGQTIDELERRLNALGAVTSQLPMPEAEQIRERAARGHRFNTIAVVLVAVVGIVLGSVALTDGRPLTQLASDSYREKIGAESHDLVLDAQKITTDNLLTTAQVTDLAPSASWSIDATEEDTDETEPLTTCATDRFATTDPLKVFVRTFEAGGDANERVTQSIEVARGVAPANEAYLKAVDWYAGCELPRVQLTESYRVPRPFGDVLILRLVDHNDPNRTLTVGIGWSGTVTSTIIHQTDGADAPTIEDFARTISDSFEKVCSDSGGQCSEDPTALPADPPPLPEDPGFLGTIDLPALAGVENPWASTEPDDTATNPASTTCDQADFAASGGTSSARIFLAPDAQGAATPFGLVESVGTFPTAEAATAFVDQVQAAMNACPQTNLAAAVGEQLTFGDTPDYRGATWALTLQVEGGEPVTLRSAIVQRGTSVAQILFTPAAGVDFGPEAFTETAQRATQRLIYAAPPA
ncbi:sensor domain-containing protein [Aeromicrobium alkaliterrae]|uniref:PknH-like extracellular domain-containing protein n=1 Tax=Aeromicrobium alkaliterrae TaxID=302168 RepID=A0ABP4WIL9_9ACTN